LGKSNFFETSKAELLDLWQSVLKKNNITVQENSKVELVSAEGEIFKVITIKGEQITAASILLAIGRRGTPRKLNIPGEIKEKVAYRLIETEGISGNEIIVVGGGDSAVESALLLADDNHVILSYRNEVFNRLKPNNSMALNKAIAEGKMEVRLNSNLVSIEDESVTLIIDKEGNQLKFKK